MARCHSATGLHLGDSTRVLTYAVKDEHEDSVRYYRRLGYQFIRSSAGPVARAGGPRADQSKHRGLVT